MAFLTEDKYLTCSVSAGERPALKRCTNSSLEGPLPNGARVEWCFNNRTTCISNSSLQASSTLPPLNVLDNGTLYLHYVTFDQPADTSIECSYYNSEGIRCSPPVFINLTVHRPSGNWVRVLCTECYAAVLFSDTYTLYCWSHIFLRSPIAAVSFIFIGVALVAMAVHVLFAY